MKVRPVCTTGRGFSPRRAPPDSICCKPRRERPIPSAGGLPELDKVTIEGPSIRSAPRTNDRQRSSRAVRGSSVKRPHALEPSLVHRCAGYRGPVKRLGDRLRLSLRHKEGRLVPTSTRAESALTSARSSAFLSAWARSGQRGAGSILSLYDSSWRRGCVLHMEPSSDTICSRRQPRGDSISRSCSAAGPRILKDERARPRQQLAVPWLYLLNPRVLQPDADFFRI